METKSHRIAEIRKLNAEDLARNDLLNLWECPKDKRMGRGWLYGDKSGHLILDIRRHASIEKRSQISDPMEAREGNS